MAAGTVTKLAKSDEEIVSIATDGAGTINRIIRADGSLWSHTISGDALASVVTKKVLRGTPVQIIYDGSGTYNYILFKTGQIIRHTISGNALTEILKAGALPNEAVAICLNNSVLYVATKDGTIYSVTLS